MPKILERLVSQLEAKGKDKSSAYAIANSQLQKHGILKRGSEKLTKKGKKRNSMTPEQRAKSRASKRSKKPMSKFVYSKRTNRATLKKKK